MNSGGLGSISSVAGPAVRVAPWSLGFDVSTGSHCYGVWVPHQHGVSVVASLVPRLEPQDVSVGLSPRVTLLDVCDCTS